MAKQNFSSGSNPYSSYNRRRYGSPDTIGDVLEGFLTTIEGHEQDREARRQKWRDDQAAFAKSRDELKASPNQNANAFMANWSQGLQNNARKLQHQLENGLIRSADYTKAWANLTNSNTQLISAQTNYQQQAQKLYEDFTAGTGSGANMDSINEFNRLTDWANLKTEINEDGSMNVFNAKTSEVVTPYFLSNLTGSNVLKYQAQAEAKKIVDQFGARSVRNGLGVTIEGTYLLISADKEAQADLEEALTSVSRGMLNNSSTASVLIDQLGYKTVWDKKDVKKGKTILRKADGTFDVEDEQHAADAFMVKTLKAALPYTKEEPELKPQTSYDKRIKDEEKKEELSFELAYDLTLGGEKAKNNKEIIKANNDKIEDLNETEDSWVIEYKDGSDDKIIQKIKKTVDGKETYDREATAEALYTIVDPNSNPIKAQKARHNYFKTRETRTPVSTDLLVSTRQPTPAANTTNFYTNQEAAKGKKAVTINAEIESITDLDEASAPKLESIIRGIQTFPGADTFFDTITVKPSPASTGWAEVIRVKLPQGIASALKEKPFVRSSGSDYIDVTVEGSSAGGITEDEGRSNLNQLIDSLIAEMTNKHNASKGVVKRRSIKEIMEQEGVGRAEAVEIFNAK